MPFLPMKTCVYVKKDERCVLYEGHLSDHYLR